LDSIQRHEVMIASERSARVGAAACAFLPRPAIPVVASLTRATAFLLTLASPAVAQFQPSPELRNPNVAFDYYEPRDAGYAQLYKKLQARQILEELGQFLAPVRWPHRLRLVMKQCPASTAEPQVFYTNIEYSITLCYQWFWRVERFAPPNAALGAPQQLLAGGVVGVVVHEAARAIFDMENIPRLGSEDDAADQLTAFVGLQFSKDVAQAVIKGTYWVWANYDLAIRQRNEAYNFAGRASVPPQRMLNTACIAYGADPATFKDFAPLLSGRANNCAAEYQQVQYAFDKTIKPHVQVELMKKVQSMSWLTPQDLK
jgi:hypothetical protein